METKRYNKGQLTNEQKEAANRLKSIVLEKYKTISQFARIVGVSPARISEYIHCVNRITDKTALKIQKATGISSKYLLFGIGDIMLSEEEEKSKNLFRNNISPVLSEHEKKKLARGNTDIYVASKCYIGVSFKLQGSGNVLETILDSFSDKFISVIVTTELQDASYLQIKAGTILILDPKSTKGLVFATIKNKPNSKSTLAISETFFDVGTYKNNIFTSINTNNSYEQEYIEDIHGEIISKIERFK